MKLKKLLAAGLAVVTMAAAVPMQSVQDFIDDFSLTASARGGFESNNCGAAGHESEVTWKLTETGGTVTYNNGSSDVTESALKLTISGTGDMADYESSNAPWNSQKAQITEAEIASGVKSIGMYAFYNCLSLRSITIPDSVTSIGNYAFRDCTSLTSITIPGSVTSIGKGAFASCKSLTSITIPDSVTSIGENAFYNCALLTSITIPGSVTSIGSFAFRECTSLTSITIPDSVKSIGNETFRLCSKLKTVIFQGNVHSINSNVFDNCSALTTIYSADTEPVSINSISTTNYTTGGEFNGTCGKTDTDKVYWVLAENGTVPNSSDPAPTAYKLYIFGKGAMADVAYNNPLPWYDKMYQITEAEIASGVTSIGEAAFIDYSSLASITIPDSVESIGEKAFHSCTNLSEVTFKDEKTIKTWGQYLFYIYDYVNFVDALNTNIKKVNFKYKSSIDKYKSMFPESCEFTYQVNDTYHAPAYDTYEQNGITYHIYDDYAEVYECDVNAESVEIPSVFEGDSKNVPVTRIGENAFNSCKSLTDVKIPDSITEIGANAFWGCTSLKTIIIPKTVTNIDKNAFSHCTAFETIYGYTGSAAETFAKTYGYTFIALDAVVTTTTTAETPVTTTTTTIITTVTTASTATESGTTAVTTTGLKPSAPTNVAISADGTVTWDKVDNAAQYKVFKKYGGTAYHSGWVTDNSYRFKSLPREDYEIYVAAKNEYGTSWSKHLQVKVENPLGTVRKVNVSNGTVSWNAVQGAVAYKVAKVVNGKTYYGSKTNDASYTFNSVPKKDYQVFVVAFDKEGKKSWGSKNLVEVGNLGTVLDPKVDAKGNVTWTAARNAVKYKVGKTVNGKTYYTGELTTNSTTIKVPKSDYKVFVVAFDKEGNKTWGTKVEVKMK